MSTWAVARLFLIAIVLQFAPSIYDLAAAQNRKSLLTHSDIKQFFRRISEVNSKRELCSSVLDLYERYNSQTQANSSDISDDKIEINYIQIINAIRIACHNGVFSLSGSTPYALVSDDDFDYSRGPFCPAIRSIPEYFNLSYFIFKNDWIKSVDLSCLKEINLIFRNNRNIDTIHFFGIYESTLSVEKTHVESINILFAKNLNTKLRSTFGTTTLGFIEHSDIDLSESKFNGDLIITNSQLINTNLKLRGSYIYGNLQAEDSYINGDLDAQNLYISRNIFADRSHWHGNVYLNAAQVDNEIQLEHAEIGRPHPGHIPYEAGGGCGLRGFSEAQANWLLNVPESGRPSTSLWEGSARPHDLRTEFQLKGMKIGTTLTLSSSRIMSSVEGHRLSIGSSFASDRTCWLNDVMMPDVTVGRHVNFDGADFSVGSASEIDFSNWNVGTYISATSASFGSRLHVPGLKIGSSFFLNNGRFRGGMQLEGASIPATLSLTDIHATSVPGWNDNVVYSCNLMLVVICRSNIGSIESNNATIDGALNLFMTNITKNLTLSESTISGWLGLEQMKIGINVYLRGAKELHHVNFLGTTIDGNVNASDIREWNGSLWLKQTTIGGSLILDNMDKFSGYIDISDSQIKQHISFTNSSLEYLNGCDIYTDKCIIFNGTGMIVGGNVNFSNTNFPSKVSIDSSIIKGDILLAGSIVEDHFDLSQTEFRVLWLRDKSCRAPLPVANGPRRKIEDGEIGLTAHGALILAGAKFTFPAIGLVGSRVYDAAGGKRSEQAAAVRIKGAEYNLRSNLSCPNDLFFGDGAAIGSWLSSELVNADSRDPQPYEQAARALAEVGRKSQSEDVLRAKFERRETNLSWMDFDKWALLVTGALVGYGLTTERAFLWWIGLVALGMLVRLGFHRLVWNRLYTKAVSPFQNEAIPYLKLNCFVGRYRFNLINHAFWFSFCSAVPLVSDLYPPKALDRERTDDIPPRIGPCRAEGYFILHKILAYFFVTIAIAGAAGLIK